MKMFHITLVDLGTGYIEKTLEGVLACLDNSEVGEKWEIEIIEMSEEEYKSLPEFKGF